MCLCWSLYTSVRTYTHIKNILVVGLCVLVFVVCLLLVSLCVLTASSSVCESCYTMIRRRVSEFVRLARPLPRQSVRLARPLANVLELDVYMYVRLNT